MMDVNVKQRWLQGDWFSSIQLAFLEGMTAVKANQPFTESQHVPHLLHVPSRSVPVYLSRSNMPKSCQTCILLDFHSVILVMRNICLFSGCRCSAAVWPLHRITSKLKAFCFCTRGRNFRAFLSSRHLCNLVYSRGIRSICEGKMMLLSLSWSHLLGCWSLQRLEPPPHFSQEVPNKWTFSCLLFGADAGKSPSSQKVLQENIWGFCCLFSWIPPFEFMSCINPKSYKTFLDWGHFVQIKDVIQNLS